MRYKEEIFTGELPFKDAVVLRELHTRVDDSEKEHKKLSEQYKNPSSESGRTYTPPKPDNFRISKYLKDGEWFETVYNNKEGGKAFKAMIKGCLDNYDPDGIVIKLFPKKGSGYEQKDYTLYFDDDKKAEANKKAEPVDFNKMREEIQSAISGLGLGNPGEKASSGIEMKMLEMKFDHTRELDRVEKKLNSEIETLRRRNETLQGELEEANGYIEELEQEASGFDKTLGSVRNQFEEKERNREENVFVTVGADMIRRAGEFFLAKNPEFLDGLSLNEEQKKSILSRMKNQGQLDETANRTTANNVSFDDVSEDAKWKEGKHPDHVTAILNIFVFCQTLPMEQFKKLYDIFQVMCDEEGKFITANADGLLEYIKEFISTEANAPA